MNTKNAIRGTLASKLLSSMKKQNPAVRRVQLETMLGKVKSHKFRLPKVSMVCGNVNHQPVLYIRRKNLPREGDDPVY
jgi:hypothetical protein